MNSTASADRTLRKSVRAFARQGIQTDRKHARMILRQLRAPITDSNVEYLVMLFDEIVRSARMHGSAHKPKGGKR